MSEAPNARVRPINTSSKNFQIILSDMISPDDRAKLLATLSEFRSGAHVRSSAVNKGFTLEMLDPRGRVGVLKWKGIEIALLFQRAIGTVTMTSMEMSPAVWITSPEEAWVSFNLLNVKQDQEVSGLRNRVVESEARSCNFEHLLKHIKLEAEQKGMLVETLNSRLETIEAELSQYKDAEKKSRTLPDGRQLLVKVKYKTRTKYVEVKPAKKTVAKSKKRGGKKKP